MKEEESQKHIFHVSGMHCKACVLVTEQTLGDVSEIENVKVDGHKQTVTLTGDFGEKSEEEIVSELSKLLASKGYSLSTEKILAEKKWDEFLIALPLAFFFILLFIVLQKMGIVNLVHASKMTYSSAFLIGVVASLSSCMAVVGGLVLSLSATFAKEGDSWKPQILFHVSRIVSFFILGGVVGALGATFQLGAMGTFVLGFLVGLVMLLMGINLLDIFHGAKRFTPVMPKFLSKRALNTSNMTHSFAPVLVGAATFFLPCGFTQSMQVYTLSTGSFQVGALTMFAFALGTFPALALVSFGGASVSTGKNKGIFFKTAGLVVIAFALFNILNSLVVIGVIKNIFNF